MRAALCLSTLALLVRRTLQRCPLDTKTETRWKRIGLIAFILTAIALGAGPIGIGYLIEHYFGAGV